MSHAHLIVYDSSSITDTQMDQRKVKINRPECNGSRPHKTGTLRLRRKGLEYQI